jgi:hypothetical protein
MELGQDILSLIKQLRKDATTSGIYSATGLNYYNLEPQAKNIYPVFYPLLASTPRRNPMFNGMRVGGTGINWKAITAIDAGGYPAISEGNRNAFMSYTEKDFYAPFKFLGKDTEVSFQAQQMGLGFDDNIAIAQLGQLNALLNGEERMILFGNSGPSSLGGTYGYALGVTPTPVLTVVPTQAGSNGQSGGLPIGSVTVYCVAVTPWGTSLATATGVALPWLRQNADGSTDVINGGTGTISAASATATTTAGNQTVKVVIPTVLGAVGYALYVSTSGVPTISNAYFWGISSTDTAFISNAAPNTNQTANGQSSTISGAPGNLTADHSYNNLDFDGLMTWCFNWSVASQPSYVLDLGGNGFTSGGDGTIVEFENVMNWAWLQYKLTFDAIYTGGALIQSASKAIITTGSGAAAAQRIIFDRDADGTLKGGTKLVEYRSKFSNTGAPKSIPVMTHPWMPDGCVYFHLKNNPYPAAGAAIPSVWDMVSLEDHFSIKWPYRRLQHELGTYCFETLRSYIPFGAAMLTGVANKVNP